ncbi:MAG: exonuclease SbcCD subunit D [Syntrophobacteraceae bacterium]
MFKFIHSADIHLDSPMYMLDRYEGAPVDEIRGATRRASENLVDLAMDEQVDFVLISGDLYDGDWKDYNTGLFLVSQMARLHEARIPVFIVSGNHDAANRMTRTLRHPERIHSFKSSKPATFTLDSIGVAIHGQSFTSQAVYDDLSQGYPPSLGGYYNIGMLHTCAGSRAGHAPYAPCTVQGLSLKNYDYWALGHVHTREILCESPLIVFPGNTQGRHIRETGPKGCMLVTVDEKGRTHPEFRSLDVIRWEMCDIDAAGAESAPSLIDRIIERLTEASGATDLPLIVRLNVKGECPVHDRLSSEMEALINDIRSEAILLNGGRIWIEKVVLDTAASGRLLLQPGAGPVAELMEIMQELIRDPDYLSGVGDSLGDIWSRLPREVKESFEVIAPEDKDGLKKLIEEVPSMLLRRFVAPAGKEI